jgi:hypothetical protein
MPSYLSTIHRLQREISDLRRDDAALISKEAATQRKANAAQEAAARSKVLSTVSSKLREAERALNELATLSKKRADISRKLTSKSKELSGYQERQAKEDERSRKKIADEQKRLLQQNEARARSLNQELAKMSRNPSPPLSADRSFDFFISHASEDKEDFVAALATELTTLGAEVFYDDATLKVGDSLRRNIDAGLRNSRYGIVVLSTAFFKKEWTARELDGLTTLEVGGQSRILPIWHKVSKDEVAAYSAVLADKLALNTSNKTVKEIAAELHAIL